ncbi:MAG: ABC transporter substrate-binding protein [Anaerolineales bacterium]
MKVKSIFMAILLISLLMAACAQATPQATEVSMEEAARQEGAINSYGMSDDWVNLGYMWKTIEDRYGVVHTDTDMTSAEQITRLDAEKDAPVLDVADIGYDFLGTLLEKEYAMSFLVNTDVVQNKPQIWDDLLKPEYQDMICSRDPRVSTYATASVLSAAYSHGGGEENVQPGLDFFKELRESGNWREGVVLNVAAVQKGECPISLVYDFDGFAKRDSTGLPLEVIIPSDATVGMIFAQYINSRAPHPNAAKLTIDYFYSDEGQIAFATGYAHTSRDVQLPADVASKLLPESAYPNLYFPKSLESFTAAVKNIVDGWNAIVGSE